MKTKEEVIKSFENDKQQVVSQLNILLNLITQKEFELEEGNRAEIIQLIKEGQHIIKNIDETIESLSKQQLL